MYTLGWALVTVIYCNGIISEVECCWLVSKTKKKADFKKPGDHIVIFYCWKPNLLVVSTWKNLRIWKSIFSPPENLNLLSMYTKKLKWFSYVNVMDAKIFDFFCQNTYTVGKINWFFWDCLTNRKSVFPFFYLHRKFNSHFLKTKETVQFFSKHPVHDIISQFCPLQIQLYKFILLLKTSYKKVKIWKC